MWLIFDWFANYIRSRFVYWQSQFLLNNRDYLITLAKVFSDKINLSNYRQTDRIDSIIHYYSSILTHKYFIAD